MPLPLNHDKGFFIRLIDLNIKASTYWETRLLDYMIEGSFIGVGGIWLYFFNYWSGM
jgi:hypothetical protein